MANDLLDKDDPSKNRIGLQVGSYLTFMYPGANKKLYIPILENPDIRESQISRLQSYEIIGRNNSLVSYKSSESRRFDLNFNITYDHVESVMRGVDGTKFDARFGNYGLYEGFSRSTYTVILKWLEIIRSSTKNNSKTPSHGPPTIRLVHGDQFRGIPCVATDYSITMDNQQAGAYKIPKSAPGAFIPKLIRVRLNLQEVRIGNFGSFKSTVTSNFTDANDNNTGWEALFEATSFSMDPGQPIDPFSDDEIADNLIGKLKLQ